MTRYGLMDVKSWQLCIYTDTDKTEVEEKYRYDLKHEPERYKIVKVYIDENPPTSVVKGVTNDRVVAFIPDDIHKAPQIFDHIQQAIERVGEEGDLYQHIGRMSCTFTPIEEM